MIQNYGGLCLSPLLHSNQLWYSLDADVAAWLAGLCAVCSTVCVIASVCCLNSTSSFIENGGRHP